MDLKFQFEEYVLISFPVLQHWIMKLLHLGMKISVRNYKAFVQLKTTFVNYFLTNYFIGQSIAYI
jgi:hypothetical protein